MWSERELELTRKYTEEIRQQYNKGSIVPLLANVRRETDAQAPDFFKFARRFIIPRELFDEGHIIIVRPFADFVVHSEYQHFIDVLKETSVNRPISETAPDIEMIDSAIESISNLTQPNFIIIPIAFYVSLHALSRAARQPVINYENGQQFYDCISGRLRILWSNKFINLREIIVGNSRDSSWLFKSANGNERLTAEFYLEDPRTNPILLVQTVFRFLPPPAERIRVIEFPQDLCEIE